MYILQFDGLYRSIPGQNQEHDKAGFMCYGWLIYKNERLIARGHGAFARSRDASSNIAEYLALIEGLEALGDLDVFNAPVKVLGDAKCIIDQMRGAAAVNAHSMKALHIRAGRLAKRFRTIQWIWTPRKNNKQADSLTRKAMRQMRSNHGDYQAAIAAITAENSKGRHSAELVPLIDLRVYHPSGL